MVELLGILLTLEATTEKGSHKILLEYFAINSYEIYTSIVSLISCLKMQVGGVLLVKQVAN
jgi:hypothetical protein